MQILHQKQTSQSEAAENLVKCIPVKERLKLSESACTKQLQSKSSLFHQARLEIELATYWLLCKFVQERRKYTQKQFQKI